MFVRVTAGTTVDRKTENFAPHVTIREILETLGIDYNRGVMHLDGASLKAGEINKTLADFGYDGTDGHDRCYLLNVVKADNA